MRTVTPLNHPKNVVVFTAASLSEAIPLADAAMRQDGIQGAVWFSKPCDIDFEKEVLLRRAFRRGTRGWRNESGMVSDSIGKTAAEVTIRLTAKQRFKFGYRRNTANARRCLDKTRIENMLALQTIFHSVKLGVRHEVKTKINPHFDSKEAEMEVTDTTRLFFGRRLRVLNSRAGAGTLVYDLDGKPLRQKAGTLSEPEYHLPEAWQVGVGSYLFLGGDDWGRDKSILHTSPDFVANDELYPRVLDVYDCHHR
jgi:hypothetical protein